MESAILRRRGLLTLGAGCAATLSHRTAEARSPASAARIAVRKGYADGPFGQIHYRVAGRGTPLILCHQMPNSSAMYEAAYELFSSRGVMAIGIDIPGYGMSDPVPGTPTIRDYSSAIGAVLDNFHLKSAMLLGHHTGGSIAADFAMRNPRRVKRLILNAPRVPDDVEFEKTRRIIQAPPPVRRDGSHLLDMWKRRLSYPMASEDLDLANKHFCRTVLHWSDFFNGTNASVAYDIRPTLRALKVPTLIISGAQDGQFRYLEDVKALRSDFSYVAIEQASSYVADEQPRAWVEAISDFILG